MPQQVLDLETPEIVKHFLKHGSSSKESIILVV